MSPVLSRSRPPTLGTPRRRAAGVAVVAVALVVLAASVLLLPQPLPTGDLTVINPHPWATLVEIGPVDGAEFTVGRVPREQTRTFTEVPERGSGVTVRFSYHDVTVEVQVSRDELAAADHAVEVPEAFGLQLSDAGVPPTPIVR